MCVSYINPPYNTVNKICEKHYLNKPGLTFTQIFNVNIFIQPKLLSLISTFHSALVYFAGAGSTLLLSLIQNQKRRM